MLTRDSPTLFTTSSFLVVAMDSMLSFGLCTLHVDPRLKGKKSVKYALLTLGTPFNR